MSPDTDLLRRVIHAGTAPEADVAGVLKDAGLDAVVAVLADEILFRCPAPANTTPVDIALDLTHGAERRRLVFRIAAGRAVEVTEDPGPVRRELRMSVTDLIRRLFGPAGRRQVGDFHDTFLPERPDDLRTLPDLLSATSLASGTLLAGCTIPPVDLGALAVEYGSDKWASFHWYTPHYERQFACFRDQAVRVLEIGIGGFDASLGGGSLRMWKRMFHRGLIFGIDLFDKSALNEQRLTALTGDQGDPATLTDIARRHGPFDIIIDDGSHENAHVRGSFDALFPHLRDGGLYVIEDLQTSYFPPFGGTAGATAGPDTSVGLLKRLLDDIHFREQPPAGRQPGPTQSDVTGVTVYRNIAFVEKGVNGDTALPAWMDEDAWIALGAIPPGD